MRYKLAAAVAAILAAFLLSSHANAAVKEPLRFMSPPAPTGLTGLHPTSGLPGLPARDYMAPGGTLVRAPFSGCVPTNRPWGWLSYQNPHAGFGGARIYLQQTKTGRTAYLAHFGDPRYGSLFKRPGECFRQGDPVGYVWSWPNNPGRSHIHMGWQGGDPLEKLVGRNGEFLIVEGPVWTPNEPVFPRVRLRHEGQWWRVYVGTKKKVYQGGEARARVVYNRQKLARRINLHFKHTFKGSPLVGTGLMMVRIFRAHGVDPRLPAAIASCESGGGTTGRGPAVNNDFGLFDSQTGKLRVFKSRKQAIVYLAKLLSGPKYEGRTTIYLIGQRYAPSKAANDPNGKNAHWIPCVQKYYAELGGTRYLEKKK
jgi:hypothetical protein